MPFGTLPIAWFGGTLACGFRRCKASGFAVLRANSIQKERFVTQIYVGNLAYGATEEDSRQKFSEFGQVWP